MVGRLRHRWKGIEKGKFGEVMQIRGILGILKTLETFQSFRFLCFPMIWCESIYFFQGPSETQKQATNNWNFIQIKSSNEWIFVFTNPVQSQILSQNFKIVCISSNSDSWVKSQILPNTLRPWGTHKHNRKKKTLNQMTNSNFNFDSIIYSKLPPHFNLRFPPFSSLGSFMLI